MSIYDDIKRSKLEHLLVHLQSQEASLETTKLIKRVEQQIAFLKLSLEERGEKYFDTRQSANGKQGSL